MVCPEGFQRFPWSVLGKLGLWVSGCTGSPRGSPILQALVLAKSRALIVPWLEQVPAPESSGGGAVDGNG